MVQLQDTTLWTATNTPIRSLASTQSGSRGGPPLVDAVGAVRVVPLRVFVDDVQRHHATWHLERMAWSHVKHNTCQKFDTIYNE